MLPVAKDQSLGEMLCHLAEVVSFSDQWALMMVIKSHQPEAWISGPQHAKLARYEESCSQTHTKTRIPSALLNLNSGLSAATTLPSLACIFFSELLPTSGSRSTWAPSYLWEGGTGHFFPEQAKSLKPRRMQPPSPRMIATAPALHMPLHTLHHV